LAYRRLPAHAWILHQLITKLRQGSLSGPAARVRAAKVVTVPHSYGGIVAEAEASKYYDVDAMIVTGLTHYLRYDDVATKLSISLIPAGLDKRFRKLLLNPG
jgi:predicted dienelactone hydrolase